LVGSTNTFTTNQIISGSTTAAMLRVTQTGAGNALVVEDEANPDASPFVVTANGTVLIGGTISTGNSALEIFSDGSLGATIRGAGGAGARILLDKLNGTLAAPTTVVSGNVISQLLARAYTGSLYTNAAAINFIAEGTISAGVVPAAISFTTANSAGTIVERMKINSLGVIGIGANPVAGRNINFGTPLTGSSQPLGMFSAGAIQSDATSGGIYFSTWSNTAASAGNIPTIVHYQATQGTIGAGSTMGTQIGYVAGATLIGGSSNWGFQGDIPFGTNRFNLYMSGTANNYMLGRLFVGGAGSTGVMAQITNTTAADVALIVKGAAAQTGDLFEVQNSAGTSQFEINSAGLVGIGGTPTTSINLRLIKNITGAINAYGMTSQGTIQSDVTSSGYAYYSGIGTAASTVISSVYHYGAIQGTFDATSTVTAQSGFFVSSGMTGATNNFGFRGQLASGANRFNIYMDGSAANWLQGTTAIGSVNFDSNANLRITNSSDIVGIKIRLAASQSGSGALRVEDSSGNILSGISPNGNFHIGTVPSTGSLLRINKAVTGQTAPNVMFINSQVDGDYAGLVGAHGLYSTLGASGTTAVPSLTHFICQDGTVSTPPTIQYGFHVAALTNGVSNFAFRSDVNVGTNRWNLYMAGSAANYMAGRLGVGATITSGAMVLLQNTTAADKTLIVKGAASQTGHLLEFQDSAGSVLGSISSAGFLTLTRIATINQINGPEKAFVIRGATGQTGDLQNWNNVSSVTLGGVNGAGQIFTGSTGPLFWGRGGATTATSGDGTTATITTTSAHGCAVGDIVTVSGITPTGYNGTFVLTAVATNTISYANATTGAQTVAGTIGVPAQATITARSAGSLGLVVRGAASQSANLQEWRDSSSTVLASINSVGYLATAFVDVKITNSGINTFRGFGASGQTGDLLALGYSNFNTSAGFASSGELVTGINASGWAVLTSAALGQVTVYPRTTSTIGQVIRGAASQTANLQQWQNSAGTVLAYVAADGSSSFNEGDQNIIAASIFS
jgi:hypothetical protein